MVQPEGARDDDVALRTLLVLETLGGMAQPASLADVMVRTRLPKSKAYRALRALQDNGFIDRVGREGYRIGARSLALAPLLGPRPAFLRSAGPVLRWLAGATGETATLFLRSGDQRVLVLAAASPDPTLQEARPQIGERAPLTSGAAGLAILAHLPDEEAAAIRRATRGRVPAGLLEEIRGDGCALSFSANRRGGNGVAAPILDPDGYPLGSIAVAGAAARLPEVVLRTQAGPLRAACSRFAPHLMTLLGPRAEQRQDSLDVALTDLVER